MQAGNLRINRGMSSYVGSSFANFQTVSAGVHSQYSHSRPNIIHSFSNTSGRTISKGRLFAVMSGIFCDMRATPTMPIQSRRFTLSVVGCEHKTIRIVAMLHVEVL